MPNNKIAILVLHGMGQQEEKYYAPLEEKLKKRLGGAWDQFAFGAVYYQDTLEPNEKFVYERLEPGFKSAFGWNWLRNFLLHYFADPASLESRKTNVESPYRQTQVKIANKLLSLFKKSGKDENTKVFIVAHSLGAQVISSYIWDAQYSPVLYPKTEKNKRTSAGIWHDPAFFERLTKSERNFISLQGAHRLFTCGCNIPLFTAGHDYIVPIKKPNDQFKWLNYYSKYDVLGWPISQLLGRKTLEGADLHKDPEYIDHPTYAEIAEDHVVHAGNIFKRFSPLAHNEYFTSMNFIEPLAIEIEKALI